LLAARGRGLQRAMRTILSLPLACVLGACTITTYNNTEEPEPEPVATTPAPAPTPAPTPAPAPTGTGEATAPPAVTGPKPKVQWTGLATPESVLYDAANDRYLVSNINGKPLDADNNGFISELSPDGTVKNLKWIEAGKNKVTLNAPKGMAIVGGVLYVADIDSVRMFDAKTGEPKGYNRIDGATFLNDVASTAGKEPIYVTDSGMKQGANDFEPTGSDAVHMIEKGTVKVFAKGTQLGRPNGVVVTPKGVYINTFGGDEVYRLVRGGKREDITKVPKGGLDGLAVLGNQVIVSSWQGQTVYKGTLGGTLEPMVAGAKAPADFDIDPKRQLILIPRFQDNVVQGFALTP